MDSGRQGNGSDNNGNGLQLPNWKVSIKADFRPMIPVNIGHAVENKIVGYGCVAC